MVDVGPLTPEQPPLEGVEEYVNRLGGTLIRLDGEGGVDTSTGEAVMRRADGGYLIIPPGIDNAPPMLTVLRDIESVRRAQDAKYGEQNHRDGTGGGPMLATAAGLAHSNLANATARGSATWYHLLRDETMQAAIETDPRKLRDRLIRIAALSAAWAECLDRRLGIAAYCERADTLRTAHPPTNVTPSPVPPTPAAHDVPGSE